MNAVGRTTPQQYLDRKAVLTWDSKAQLEKLG